MIPAQAVEAAAKRRNLFRGVDVLLKSGAGNIWRPFPYADDEILDGPVSDRTTHECEHGQVIPAEAVEAAAKAVWYGGTAPGCGYGDIPAAARSTLEKDVREILEAAAPYMLAEAWEQGRDAEFQRSVMKRQADPNPYRRPDAV